MENDFSIYFHRRKQFCEVFLWDVHPATFHRWKGGRWGYYDPIRHNDRFGKFGELHFVKSRIRFDTIVHELDHLRTDYMWSRGFTLTRHNEERMACFLDELTRKFLRELRKINPEVKL